MIVIIFIAFHSMLTCFIESAERVNPTSTMIPGEERRKRRKHEKRRK